MPHAPQSLQMIAAVELQQQYENGVNHHTGNHQHSATTLDTKTTTTAIVPVSALSKGHSSPNNSNNSKSRRRRRSVDFSADIVTHEVEHMEDLPGEFIWYSKEEYDAIKGRNAQIVKLIKSGEFEENDDYSCRGLEHKLKEIFRQRRANKFNALNAVLEEQDRQINRGGGYSDPTLISAAYQTVTVRCAESAHTIACRDYRFSLNYNPDKPASGHHHHRNNKGASKKKSREHKNTGGDDNNNTNHTRGGATKEEKKKKKKDKKDREKEVNAAAAEPDDAPLSPKKKGTARKMVKGARKMYRRMSM